MKKSFGSRTDLFYESVIREMTRLGEKTGAINLSQGLPEIGTPPSVIQAASAAILDGENQYTFPFGSPEFRNAIAQNYLLRWNSMVNPETEITVTCGVSEAVMSAILALTEPGDEVIIFEPCYENYVPDCWMAGVKPVFVQLEGGTYTLDPQKIISAFNSKTRLLILNSPHNPTGKVFTEQELFIIGELCNQFGVIALADEIYEHILFDGIRHISIATIPGMEDKTVTISGLGKTYAVTGWRVGWAVADKEISRRIRKVHDFLTVCAPAPFQKAGIVALNLPTVYYDNMRFEYTQRKNILLNALDACGMSYFSPQGAYYVLADFSRIEWDDQKYWKRDWTMDRSFAEYIARDIGVAVVPGSSFYFDGKKMGENKIRFNFAKTIPTMNAAAERLLKLSAKS